MKRCRDSQPTQFVLHMCKNTFVWGRTRQMSHRRDLNRLFFLGGTMKNHVTVTWSVRIIEIWFFFAHWLVSFLKWRSWSWVNPGNSPAFSSRKGGGGSRTGAAAARSRGSWPGNRRVAGLSSACTKALTGEAPGRLRRYATCYNVSPPQLHKFLCVHLDCVCVRVCKITNHMENRDFPEGTNKVIIHIIIIMMFYKPDCVWSSVRQLIYYPYPVDVYRALTVRRCVDIA